MRATLLKLHTYFIIDGVKTSDMGMSFFHFKVFKQPRAGDLLTRLGHHEYSQQREGYDM